MSNIHVRGRVMLDAVDCQHCNSKIFNSSLENIEVCESCGAKYKLVTVNMSDNEPKAEYTFSGFNCIDRTYFSQCNNTCPAPFMYCQYHCDDDSIKKAEKSIDDAKEKVVEAEEKLKAVKESKKTWMVTELSGISNE
jgi:hypothetical protein